jgi:hypothetical protein
MCVRTWAISFSIMTWLRYVWSFGAKDVSWGTSKLIHPFSMGFWLQDTEYEPGAKSMSFLPSR